MKMICECNYEGSMKSYNPTKEIKIEDERTYSKISYHCPNCNNVYVDDWCLDE